MNNQCPTCGAIYNVTPKDVGRRIRCKKCSTGLVVTDAGLEADAPTAGPAPRPVPAPAPAPDFDPGEVEVQPAPRRGRDRRRSFTGGLNIDPVQVFRDFGGVPSLLFGVGAFLVIVFLFQPLIGLAAVQRAQGGVERIDLEWKTKERQMRRDKKGEDEISAAREKFYKDRDKDAAEEDVGYEAVGVKRARWAELYGMMFGFLFLMAGSLGYMMPGQTSIRRIVGAVVLTAQMLIVFMVFAAGGGCGGGGAATKFG